MLSEAKHLILAIERFLGVVLKVKIIVSLSLSKAQYRSTPHFDKLNVTDSLAYWTTHRMTLALEGNRRA